MRKITKLLLIGLLPIMAYADNNYPPQQVIDLQQTALTALTQGGNLKDNESKIFLGVTIKGNLDKAQAAWQAAINLAPERVDLRYALASTEVLNGKVELARQDYAAIESYTPNSPQLLALEAGYAKAMNEKESYYNYANRLSLFDDNSPYFQTIKLINEGFTLPINQNISKSLNHGKSTAIIILGYALHSDGTMDDKLIARLKQGLSLYQLNPAATIVVSGGVAQGGVTEAYLMREWLINNGVNSQNIILEDKSIDTVSNALNSLAKIQNLELKNLVIVSSASHLRRATTLFKQASYTLDKDYKIANLAAWDFPDSNEPLATTNEKALIVRDTFRTAGIWAYPGMLR